MRGATAPVLALMTMLVAFGLADPRLRGLAINTLLLCAAVAGLSLPAAVLLASLLTRTDLPARRFFVLLLLLLLFTPLYLQAAAWEAGFGIQGAALPWIARLAPGLVGQPIIAGWPGTIWVHAAGSLAWGVLLVSAGFLAVERPIEELAWLDLSPLRVFCKVTLPRTMPALLAAAAWVVIVTAGEMTVTNLFQVRTFSEELYTQLSFGESLLDLVLAGWPAWLVTIAFVLAGGVAIDRFLARALAVERHPLIFSLGRWRIPAAMAIAILLTIFIAVPLCSLIAKAGIQVAAGAQGERLRSWSAAKCISMVVASPMRFRREFGWSLVLATSSATLSLVLAIPPAWWARRSTMGRRLALAIAAIGLALPGPVIGLAIIKLLNQPHVPALTWLYDRTIAPPLLALFIRSTPIAVLVLWYAMNGLPNALFEMAQLDGLSVMTQLRRIVLPLRGGAFLAAWLACFAIGLGDLSATILVLPPGIETIALRLFERLHFGAEDQVAAVSLALLIVFSLIGSATLWLRDWRWGRQSRASPDALRG